MIPWEEIARRFGASANALPLDPRAVSFIRELSPRRPVLVACSGGADSVCLVLSLLTLMPDRSRLHVVHFNHGLRGENADSDAAFVKNMASALGLPASVGNPETQLVANEAALREARYSWMLKRYRSVNAGAICLGHHADDLLESQLMALVTGSGPSGLASPEPVRRFLDGHFRVRPLIRATRTQIEEALSSAGAQWREDESNQEAAFTRNRLRQQVMPLLRKNFPQDVYTGSATTQALMAEAMAAIDELIGELGLDFSNSEHFDVDPIKDRSPGLVRRAIHSWWLRHRSGLTLPKSAMDAVVQAIAYGAESSAVSIGNDLRLQLDSAGQLTLSRETSNSFEPWVRGITWCWKSGPVFLPTGAVLTAEVIAFDSSNIRPYEKANPDREAWLFQTTDILHVRQWQPGDRYRPIGSPGSRKLQDLFVDRKMKTEQKHRVPVLVDSSGAILWVPGFAPDEHVRVPAGANSALKLTYNPHSSRFSLEHGR